MTTLITLQEAKERLEKSKTRLAVVAEEGQQDCYAIMDADRWRYEIRLLETIIALYQNKEKDNG